MRLLTNKVLKNYLTDNIKYYEYLGKFGDCVDLNTLDNTYYVYPERKDFSVTKISLAVEEIYKHISKNR